MKQFGIFDSLGQKYYANQNNTKCLTRDAIRDSHQPKSKDVVVKIEDVYGMLILLIIGLSASLFVAIIECIAYKLRDRKKEQTKVNIFTERHPGHRNQALE